MGTRKPKPRKPPALTRPYRSSIYLPAPLLREVLGQAKREERRAGDMIRLLIQRGLRASRGPETG